MFCLALRLMHYLYVLRIDIHADLFSHIMLVIVLKQPLDLAVLALYQHLIMDTDEKL